MAHYWLKPHSKVEQKTEVRASNIRVTIKCHVCGTETLSEALSTGEACINAASKMSRIPCFPTLKH